MFDFFINLVEALAISVIISVCLKKNKLYIFFQTVLIVLITTLYNYENLTFVLVCSIIISVFLMTYYFCRKIDFMVCNQILLAMLINSFCNLVALLFLSIIKMLPIYEISLNELLFKEATILSKVINMIMAIFIHKKNISMNSNRINPLITGLLFVITVIVHTLTDAIVYGTLTFQTIQLLAFAFISYIMLFIALIFKLSKENERDLKNQRNQAQERMIKNNLKLLESITQKISTIEHKINYVLLSIKYLIIKNNNAEAINLIDENLWNLNKISFYVDTKNPYFDNLLAGVLKKMSNKNISPIIVCEVRKGVLDKNIYLSSLFIDLLDQVCLTIKEKNKLRIVIRSNKNYVILSLISSGLSQEFIEQLNINHKELIENDIHFAYKKIGEKSYEIKYVIFGVTNEL